MRRSGQRLSDATITVTPSSGNGFLDLGFPPEEAASLLIRADLMIAVRKIIAPRRLKQDQIATLLRVSQRRLRDLHHGRVYLFTADDLITMLARLGARTTVVVTPSRRRIRA